MQVKSIEGEHSAILLTFIKLPFVIKILVLSIFEWTLMTDFTVNYITTNGPAHLIVYKSNICEGGIGKYVPKIKRFAER